jgi:hypothetical protein
MPRTSFRARRHRPRAMPREGAKLATDAGLDASPLAVVRSMTAVDTILAQAERAHASAIGWGGVGSAFLGSVSHDVVQHADRPALVIPSPEVAGRQGESARARRCRAGRRRYRGPTRPAHVSGHDWHGLDTVIATDVQT